MNNLELTQEIFVRFGNADIDAIAELLHDDCVIDFYGPDEIPYAGNYVGKDNCRKFFETVLSNVNVHEFEAEEFFHQGDRVFVVGRLRLTTKATGGEIKSAFVQIIDCKDGKWIGFKEIMNSAVAQQAFTGAN